MTEVFQKDICQAFRNAGTLDGDTVIFHSSLKSMGHVDGGASTVINGALDAVGSNGTVAVPTLWFNGSKDRTPEKFDIKNSPAYNGAIAEAMRQDSRSFRSNHYSHSLSAIGAKAELLTSEHGSGKLYPDPWNETSFSEKSPWTKLYQWDALYCFIGCTLHVCTMKHWIEGHYFAELLAMLPEKYRMEFRKKMHYKMHYTFWNNFDFEAIQKKFTGEGLITESPLGDTKLVAVRTKTLVDNTLELLRNEPEKYFLDENFLQLRQEIINFNRK